MLGGGDADGYPLNSLTYVHKTPFAFGAVNYLNERTKVLQPAPACLLLRRMAAALPYEYCG